MKGVQTFLRAGVPLSKQVIFRQLLEEKALHLCDTRHRLHPVPFILEQVQQQQGAEFHALYVERKV